MLTSMQKLRNTSLACGLALALTGCGPTKNKEFERFSSADSERAEPATEEILIEEGDSQGSEEDAGVDVPVTESEPAPEEAGSDGTPLDPPEAALCGKTPAQAKFKLEIDHQGMTRVAYVSLPSNYGGKKLLPVIFSFHGFTSNADQMNLLLELNKYANPAGYITVHPEGLPIAGQQSWNAFSSPSNVDDVGFFTKMLAALTADYCMDQKNVFVTGISNGGFMSYRLACEMAERLTAIAPIAGTIGVITCNQRKLLPVLHLHGDEDMIVPYEGIGFPGAPEATARMAETNDCKKGPDALAAAPFTKKALKNDWRLEQWSDCRDNKNIYLATVVGGGHVDPWFVDDNTQAANATDMILGFFDAYRNKTK